MIDNFRKFDAEIGWLAFSQTPLDAEFRFLTPVGLRSRDHSASKLLPHYTSDPDATRQIVDWVESHGGSVEFSKTGDSSFPVGCILKVGRIQDWSDAEALAANSSVSLCVAILRAASAVLDSHGPQYVDLDWARSLGAPEDRSK